VYRARKAIDEAMDNKPPQYELVVAVDVPQSMRSCDLVLSPPDDLSLA
jgi:hypothetical protein